MKRLILFLLLLSSPAWATISVTQHLISSSNCGATSQTCNLTITSTTAGNLGFASIHIGVATEFITSISGGGTWVAPGGCQGVDTGAAKATSCAYNLTLTGGTTSITVTRTSTTNAGTWRVYFAEIHTDLTGGSFTLDTNAGAVGNRDQSTSVTNPAGVALTLNGANDALFQTICGVTPSAINGSYTTSDFSGSGGYGIAINTATGTAPTWTTGSGKAGLGGIGFTETSSSSGHCAGCELSRLQFPLSRRRPLIE